MGTHESPESALAAVETGAIRLHAVRLIDQYEAHMFGDLTDLGRPGRMDQDAWLAWEGQAYAVLREVARG